MATLTLNLSDKEDRVLEELSLIDDTSKTAVLRKALRLYQLVTKKQANGETLCTVAHNNLSELIII